MSDTTPDRPGEEQPARDVSDQAQPVGSTTAKTVGTGAGAGSGLDPIEAAIAEISAGRPIVVVDDEDRENEGDLIIAAEFATAETMGFFVRYTSGVICAPMEADRAAALALPPMVTDNEDPKGTAYTISCDAVGVTTGISAAERALTGRALATADPDPAAITRPGHVFPLIAKSGGVRERPGHTEAGVELSRLAGAQPVSMIAEVVHDDGSMMRFDALREFATAHGLVMVSIEQLVEYLEETDGRPAVPKDLPAEVPLPTKYGTFTARAFTVDGHDHLGVYTGLDLENASRSDSGSAPAPLVRVHSECLTGDVFGSYRCDCGEQLELALSLIAEQGGAVVYLTGHEGRGIGLSNKIKAYALQDSGLDTVEANLRLGFYDDVRDYRAAAEFLHALGLTRIRLLTNNPEKTHALEALGITVEAVVPIEIPARPENSKYLATKRNRMHHTLTLAG
ncbi:3,4-dihydroxy 2-butanone 4-phosphate synthase/GTP cyclohydrolase II [Brevibacterium sanguinis]|uniref:GTP cyclohydrolase-2 n=2 Tax=Brevibacterium TaxID=1696 RepID=A0A366IDS4_9MICO|nr:MULTISPECIES: 3,4-dihydroxy-2-butanone-4-phosphate synthase [Brevibacterium]RBP62539.1 3,4-dihydroxy 2-butanone 4-phosphate synthase/GTP cyclohydrolase II [Brevibacterium sanguinis]RBP69203.1 3,4-dihydroxy 2-butanone 4-phosphate synthase/GTP cyclohydrolase II [Brevibacterium celere]